MGYVGVSSGLHLGIFYDFVGFCLVNLAFKVSFRVAFGFHLKFVLAQGFLKFHLFLPGFFGVFICISGGVF